MNTIRWKTIHQTLPHKDLTGDVDSVCDALQELKTLGEDVKVSYNTSSQSFVVSYRIQKNAMERTRDRAKHQIKVVEMQLKALKAFYKTLG